MSDGEEIETLSEIAPPAKTKKRTFREAEIEEGQEEEEIICEPIKNSTKKEIFNLLGYNVSKEAEALIPTIKKVSEFSEEDGKTFLDCLYTTQHCKLNGALSKTLVVFLSRAITHPNDKSTFLDIQNDDNIKDGISQWIGWFLMKFGNFAPLIILGLYGGTSWLNHYDFKKTPARPTVSDDNLREKPNGQDNNVH